MSAIYVVSAGDGYYPKSGNDDWQGIYTDLAGAMQHDRYKPRWPCEWDDDDEARGLWDWFSIVSIDLETREHEEVVYEGWFTRYSKSSPYLSERYRARHWRADSTIIDITNEEEEGMKQ